MVKNKASGLAEVVDHIRASFDNRMTFLRQNLNETRKTLTDFKEDRKKMSQELTSYLKNYSGDLRKGNAKRIIDFRLIESRSDEFLLGPIFIPCLSIGEILHSNVIPLKKSFFFCF